MTRLFSRNAVALLVGWMACAAPALAAPHEVKLPLRDGKLHVADLSAAVCREVHLPAFEIGSGDIDLSGLRGSLFVHAMNAALSDGCRLTLDNGALVLHVDADKLPAHCDDAKLALRTFTLEIAPEAAARQAKHWGLFVPEHVDPTRPLVVLVHGLDSGHDCLRPLGDLLTQAGYQVAYFSYPDNGPIDDSAKLFADRVAALHTVEGQMKIDIIAHSMGGLVARDYIEGEHYQGGVDRLILIGSPNYGSKWAKYSLALAAQEQYHEWRTDADWSWTWAITNGLGEAGRDLKPNSKFLKRLNALPRRDGVRYTIIAGNQHPASRIGAKMADTAAHWVPDRASQWWGLRQYQGGLEHYADRLRRRTGVTDGPVSIESAKLKGVSDFVTVAADHNTLIYADGINPPGALEPIKKRLAE
ncbi:MAG: Alpha/beta hydrolase family protein [Phycisphaerales bacterium]|nr:Alpha/beta hydrolase family protein [Phycisphaerales bacterium]